MRVNGNIQLDKGDLKGGYAVPYLYVRDEKSSGTDGGTFTSGAWRTRDLNTVVTNTVEGASLASNQLTLPAGTYYVEASAPANYCQNHKTRLQNVTLSQTEILGTSQFTQNSQSHVIQGRSYVWGRFTLYQEAAIELQHRCAVTRNTNGFGIAHSFGGNEVYSELELWRIL